MGVLSGQGLLISEGELWRRQRKLIQPLFHHDRIREYGDVMISMAEKVIAKWRPGATIDFHEEMISLTMQIISKTMFNIDLAASAENNEIAQSISEVLRLFNAQITSVTSKSFRTSIEKPDRGCFFDNTTLCPNKQIIRIRMQRVGDKSFVPSGPVCPRRIDKSNAQFNRAAQQPLARLPVDVGSIISRLARQAHGAVTKARNGEITAHFLEGIWKRSVHRPFFKISCYMDA
jgi:cytochrome P450